MLYSEHLFRNFHQYKHLYKIHEHISQWERILYQIYNLVVEVVELVLLVLFSHILLVDFERNPVDIHKLLNGEGMY